MTSSYLFQTIKDEYDNPLYFKLEVQNLLPNKELGIYVNDTLVFKYLTDKAGNVSKDKIPIPNNFIVDFLTLGSFGQTVEILDMLPTEGIIGVGGAGDISLELRYI